MYCQLGNILCIWMSVDATVRCSFLHEVKRVPTFLLITFAQFISYNNNYSSLIEHDYAGFKYVLLM